MPEVERYHIYWAVGPEVNIEAWVVTGEGKDRAVMQACHYLQRAGIGASVTDALPCRIHVYPEGRGLMKGVWTRDGGDDEWRWRIPRQ